MNPIDKAISDIKFKIPKVILEKAFLTSNNNWTFGAKRSVASLDFLIKDKVVYPRVMEDCNLVGGQEVYVPLEGVRVEVTGDNRTIWQIPLSLTNNRRITRVYSIVHGTLRTTGLGSYHNTDGNSLLGTARGLISSNTTIPQVSFSNIVLIGENTVMGEFSYLYQPNLHLRCVVENDEQFNNLPGPAVPAFSKLVEFAVKAFIYNTLIIEMDEAMLSGGQTLGRFLSIVEEYSDANELYEEHLREVWTKTAFLADKLAHQRHIKRVTGGLH